MLSRLTEQELFNYWRLVYWFNLEKNREKRKILISFQDLYTEFNQSVGICVFNIIQLFNILKINFKSIEFSKEMYSSCRGSKRESELLKNNKNSKNYQLITRVFNNNISKKDLEDLIITPKEINFLLEFICFEIKDEDISKVVEFLNIYIEKFIDDKLLTENQNFYNFKNQEERIEFFLKENLKFGKNFIIKYDPEDIILKDDAFLFIHTLLAFEKLGYLKIEELYTFFWGENPKDHAKDYKAKVSLNDLFYSDYYNESENKIIIHNEGSGRIEFVDKILFFKNKQFNFSNSPNQYELLGTLFKDIQKEWNYDEIEEDWDPTCYEERLKQKDYWKRFYNSAKEINKKIAIETGIKDFLLMDTKQVKVNTRYK